MRDNPEEREVESLQYRYLIPFTNVMGNLKCLLTISFLKFKRQLHFPTCFSLTLSANGHNAVDSPAISMPT